MGQNVFDPEPLISYILLLGKQCIYKCKVIGSKPNMYLFKGWIDFLFQVENHLDLKNPEVYKHDKKCRTYKVGNNGK